LSVSQIGGSHKVQ